MTDPNLSNVVLATLSRGQISGQSARLIISRDDQGNEWLCLKAGTNRVVLGQLDDQRHADIVSDAQTLIADPTMAWVSQGISDYTEFNATL